LNIIEQLQCMIYAFIQHLPCLIIFATTISLGHDCAALKIPLCFFLVLLSTMRTYSIVELHQKLSDEKTWNWFSSKLNFGLFLWLFNWFKRRRNEGNHSPIIYNQNLKMQNNSRWQNVVDFFNCNWILITSLVFSYQFER
jgi:hypothetical protein